MRLRLRGSGLAPARAWYERGAFPPTSTLEVVEDVRPWHVLDLDTGHSLLCMRCAQLLLNTESRRLHYFVIYEELAVIPLQSTPLCHSRWMCTPCCGGNPCRSDLHYVGPGVTQSVCVLCLFNQTLTLSVTVQVRMRARCIPPRRSPYQSWFDADHAHV